jgi:glycosyltransferase involved in cell wall biosynthesis
MVAPTLGTYGGIEVFTCQIAKETLAVEGFEVRVIFRLRPGCELQDTLVQALNKAGINWRVMENPDLRYLRDLWWADVVNCHFPLIYATFPSKILQKPLVVTVENRFLPNEHRTLHRIGLNAAQLRWYISSFVAKTWEGGNLKPNSCIVPAVSNLPNRWCEIAERKGFFFIARWVPLKGIEELLEAYATANIDHSSHRLALFGDGPLRENVEALIESLKIGEFVDRPGFVSHDEKVDRMSSSRWNIAPAAFEEDLGLSPIEARSCGVPSIVSNIGGLPEAGGPTILTCLPGDVPSLRVAIETAALMEEVEYVELAHRSRASLETYLPDRNFYARSFRGLISHP